MVMEAQSTTKATILPRLHKDASLDRGASCSLGISFPFKLEVFDGLAEALDGASFSLGISFSFKLEVFDGLAKDDDESLRVEASVMMSWK
jgi:hypothetical protein